MCDVDFTDKKKTLISTSDRNENWLFSRYSTGWKCGLHADWTELTGCVDQELDKNEGETAKRRYFYITLLRAPIPRYLSEFRHVQRGATWKNARHFCLGRSATAEELPPCYTGDYDVCWHFRLSPAAGGKAANMSNEIKSLSLSFIHRAGENWIDVSLDDFADCESNLAANRQTRMLADLALVNCYNKTSMPLEERNRLLLASAKRNLAGELSILQQQNTQE